MSNKQHYSFTIERPHAQERLDQVLAKLMPEYSRTQLKAWIEHGSIRLNGELTKPKTKVKGGETISIDVSMEKTQQDEAEAIPLHIIYEDAALMVINKPAGMVTHPGPGHREHTLLNALLYHLPLLQQLPRAGLLHRLDKDTSGLLLIAKTPVALKYLSHQLKKRTLHREYQAIVCGIIISGGTINAPLGRHPLKRKQMGLVETGKEAITHYRVIEKYRAHTRLNIRLETGRTHQIRVHMTHIRHPIVGDATYGGRIKLPKNITMELMQTLGQFKRQALHAFALEFNHPLSHEWVRFESDLPCDMQQLIFALRNDMNRNKA